MEYNNCRRGRRRNGRCCNMCPYTTQVMASRAQPASRNSFLSGLYSILLMTSLLIVIYLMLEQHCITCSAKCNMSNITKNIEDIAKNLTFMKEGYCTLEKKIWKFTQAMPKVEGQVEILEELANTLLSNRAGYLAKTIPNTRQDVYAIKTKESPELTITKPPKVKLQTSEKGKEIAIEDAK